MLLHPFEIIINISCMNYVQTTKFNHYFELKGVDKTSEVKTFLQYYLLLLY